MRKQRAYWTRNEGQWQAVQAEAARRGLTVSQATEQAWAAWLSRGSTAAWVDDPEAVHAAAEGRTGTQKAAPALRARHGPSLAEDWPKPPSACRKCGHLASQHWTRGCVATCVCSEARFQG